MARRQTRRRRSTKRTKSAGIAREERMRRWARRFSPLLRSRDWRNAPIVAGLVDLVAGFRSAKKTRRLAATGEFRPQLECLEQRRLLSVWTVDDDGPADYGSIQAAINDAVAGDTVSVAAGTYTE